MNSSECIERWRICGRVQNVGFRYFSARCARRYKLKGAARNQADGTVEVIIVGPKDSISLFFNDLESGPPLASVSSIHREIFNQSCPDLTGYDVIY